MSPRAHRDKTIALLEKLEQVAAQANDAAASLANEYTEAKYEWLRLEVEDDFLTGDGDAGEYLARDFQDGIESASYSLKLAYRELSEFDKMLAKLILIRGQLEEETGVPMFSHLTGGKNWERFDHEYTM